MRAFVVLGLVFPVPSQKIGLGDVYERNGVLLCRVRRNTLLTRSLGLHKARYGFIIEFEVYDISFQAWLSWRVHAIVV